MYLGLLKQEEKKLFLELVYELASADGNYSDTEKAIIETYCAEMQIEFYESSIRNPINEVLEKIAEISDEKTKKIIIFEAIGFAMIDGVYAEAEKIMILNMGKLFGVENNFIKQCETLLNEYIQLQEKVNHLILG